MVTPSLQLERHEVRVFSAVVEEGGFSRAAERLNVSQSAVSQAIANLEHKVGTQLLIRGRTPELTEAGQRMYSYSQMLIAEEHKTLSDIDQIRSGALSTLSLATNSMVNRHFASSLLLKFCDQNPLTRLKLDIAPSKEIIYGVSEGRWELGFGPFQRNMPGLLATKVYLHEERLLVVHRNHPRFPQIMSNAVEELKGQTLLTSYLDEAPTAGRLRSQFGAVWEVSSMDLRLALAAAGKGVTYISDRLLADQTDLVPIGGLDSGTIPRDVGIYYKKHEALSTAARLFIGLCDRYFQSEPH